MTKNGPSHGAPPASNVALSGGRGTARARRKDPPSPTRRATDVVDAIDPITGAMRGGREAGLSAPGDETAFTIEFAPDQKHPIEGDSP